ncbi:hypothetical protein ACWC9T_32505 [Kitasatospora sp. NPDC001159]
MGRGVPAHVHAQAVLAAVVEARPRGLTMDQLVAATERSPAQVAVGIRHLRQIAAAEHLPPLTWSRRDGYRMVDEPEVWIGYERAFFRAEHHRIAAFIAGTLAPHQQRTPHDPYIRTVMAQMGAIESTLDLLTRLG